MQISIDQTPIAKARHRHFQRGNRVITFDPQNDDKNHTRHLIASQMKKYNQQKVDKGPLFMSLVNYVPIPSSWSNKRRNEANGRPCDTRPDLDNYQKFYGDVMNGIVYEDDKQVARSWSEKLYDFNPRVELIINPIGNFMITEHAITLTEEMTAENLDYIVKKANRLGLQKKHIARVYSVEDKEGKHIYYETESAQ